MSIIYILIPIAILLTALGIYLFFWAVKTEQFEDLEKQGMSILFDDEQQNEVTEEKPKKEIEDTKQSSDNQ
ncbi:MULTISPECIES: cbb3-type cytochrome oxidase assembly protein CcoS [Colwellia]|uniref:Cytochrome oxidase maturation protein, cbb3-type n=1 Tax=Colwellia psychrerythraea (strain 34H / ATCC BAA-681) TaxID=167879 RepID=Q483P7_COLP3|nr:MULTISPECIES: cbb3-type cytochrome oxidase assembly protein CcoS [Colwellia]AAZ25911.1 cytochrome oxidase maturation protein, cbb3-type [Colwellia psychrerythraea 34H]PKH88030.1 cbb3-type cytochrome oxidase assembly protein CcoS [Colwellia sp. Bg11-28]